MAGENLRFASYVQRLRVTHPPRWPLSPRPLAGALTLPLVDGLLMYRGAGYIAGTVTVGGVPAIRSVRLYHRGTGVLVLQTASAADGTYRFDGISPAEEFFVLATDADSDQYNAAVADMIAPAAE